MIVIIGAGISGLAAAFELTQRRVPFRILETSARPGGLIQTERWGGFTIDAGADAVLVNKPGALGLCREVGLTPLLQPMSEPRTAYVLARGRLCALPAPSVLGLPLSAGAAMRFTLLPLRARLRLLLEPFVPPGPPEDESVAAFFARRFGRSTSELVAQPLLGGIHAGDVRHLSVRSLFPNLVDAEAAGGVLRHLGRRTSAAGGPFNSLADGMDALPRAIERTLPPGAMRYRAEVRSVAADPEGWRIDGAAGSEHGTAVIFAAPVHVTARLLTTVDPQAARLCSEIPHASTVSVALAWRREAISHPLRGSGFVVAQGDVRVTACTWVSSKWERRAPSGYVLLRAFIGGMRDPQAIDLTDDELAAVATRDLGRILGIESAPDLTRVYRWPDASPQLNVGHETRVRQIAALMEPHAGLFVTGRGFRAVGIPDCIADARNVAAAAADFVASRPLRNSAR